MAAFLRRCPICATQIAFSRHLFWMRMSVWPCPRCGSMLAFKCNWFARAVGLPFLGALLYLLTQFRWINWWTATAIFVGGFLVITARDRATVVGLFNRHRYCRICRYDLSGTLKAGITRCPECGTEAETGTAGRL